MNEPSEPAVTDHTEAKPLEVILEHLDQIVEVLQRIHDRILELENRL